MDNKYYGSITPMQGKLVIFCLILFSIMIVLTIVSVILNIKRKNKKKAIYQTITSIVTLIGSYYIVGYSIRIFGNIYSDLYMGLAILIIGNILTLINLKK